MRALAADSFGCARGHEAFRNADAARYVKGLQRHALSSSVVVVALASSREDVHGRGERVDIRQIFRVPEYGLANEGKNQIFRQVHGDGVRRQRARRRRFARRVGVVNFQQSAIDDARNSRRRRRRAVLLDDAVVFVLNAEHRASSLSHAVLILERVRRESVRPGGVW